MALQSLNGLNAESPKENVGNSDVSENDSKKESMEDIIHRFDEQMNSEDSEVRLNFIKDLLSGSITYAPRQIIQYALSRMLFVSAYHSDLKATQELLENGIHVNEPDIEKGMPALALAMFHQDKDYVAYLLSKGADLFARMAGSETVLEWIIQEVDSDMIQCILDHSPTICADLLKNLSVFDACIEDGKPANIAVLINHFKQKGVMVHVNPQILMHVANHADAEVLNRLCSLGFEIDIDDENTVNAFYHAIKTGNSEIVTTLIEKGILIPDSNRGERALHQAIISERVDIIYQLIQMDIDVNALTEMGDYPLLLAAETGNPVIFGMIMEQNPDWYNHDLNELIDAMNIVMKIHFPEIIDKRDAEYPSDITQKGIDVDTTCNPKLASGMNESECYRLIKDLLHMEYVPVKCIQTLLLEADIDINAIAGDEGSLLHYAASKNLVYAIRVLLELGADINVKNGTLSGTPLLTAINNQQKDSVMLLIELGADCELTDELDNTPLMEAIFSFGIDHRVVIELLRAGVDDQGLIYAADN